MSIPALFGVRKEIIALLGVAVVAAACIWPWKALQKIQHQQKAVDQQLMQVQMLAAQAQQLRSQTKAVIASSSEQLQQTVHHHWGSAGQLTITGERAVLNVQNIPAEQWAAGLEAMQQSLAVRVENAKLQVLAGGHVSGRMELLWPSQASGVR